MRSELADQQQRDQEGVVELQVEQQANLLEDRGIFEQLRLVDDDDGLAAVAVRLEDDFVNPVHEARAVHVGALLTQRVEDFGQEFLRRAAGVAQQGDLSLIRIQLVEEGPRHHRLAASGLARDQRRTVAARQRVEQTRVEILYVLRAVEEPRIGRVLKGLLVEPPIRFVHGKSYRCREEVENEPDGIVDEIRLDLAPLKKA